MKHIAVFCYLVTYVTCVPQYSDIILRTTTNHKLTEAEPLEKQTNIRMSHEPSLSNSEYSPDKLSKGLLGLDSLLSGLISPLLSIFSIARMSDMSSGSQTSCKADSGDHPCSSVTSDDYMSDKAPASSLDSCGSCEKDTMDNSVREETHGPLLDADVNVLNGGQTLPSDDINREENQGSLLDADVNLLNSGQNLPSNYNIREENQGSLLDADVNLLNFGQNLPSDSLGDASGTLGQETESENTKNSCSPTNSVLSQTSENNEPPQCSDCKDSDLFSTQHDATYPTSSSDGNSLLSIDADILTLQRKLKSSTPLKIIKSKKYIRRKRQDSLNKKGETVYIKNSEDPDSIIDGILNSRNKFTSNARSVVETDEKRQMDTEKHSYNEISQKKPITGENLEQKDNSYNGDNSKNKFLEEQNVLGKHEETKISNKDKDYNRISHEVSKSKNDMENKVEYSNIDPYGGQTVKNVIENQKYLIDEHTQRRTINTEDIISNSKKNDNARQKGEESQSKKKMYYDGKASEKNKYSESTNDLEKIENQEDIKNEDIIRNFGTSADVFYRETFDKNKQLKCNDLENMDNSLPEEVQRELSIQVNTENQYYSPDSYNKEDSFDEAQADLEVKDVKFLPTSQTENNKRELESNKDYTGDYNKGNELENKDKVFSETKSNTRKLGNSAKDISETYANEEELGEKATGESEIKDMNSLTAPTGISYKEESVNSAEGLNGNHHFYEVSEGRVVNPLSASETENNEREFVGSVQDWSENSYSKDDRENKDLRQTENKHLSPTAILVAEDDEREVTDSAKDFISDESQRTGREQPKNKGMKSSVTSLTDDYSGDTDTNELNKGDTYSKSTEGQAVLMPEHSGRELDVLGGKGSDLFGQHISRIVWPFFFQTHRIHFINDPSKMPFQQISQDAPSFKQLERPLIGRFPQSVASSDLFGAYAYAQAPSPLHVTGYGGGLEGPGEEEVVGEPVEEEEMVGEPVGEVEGR